MIVRKPTAWGLAALAVLALSSAASATELTPDQPGGADPNGPPPMPPPMPAPGAPGSVAPPPAPGTTEAHLQQSDKEDSGVGLKLFYLQPEIGVGWASIGGTIPVPSTPQPYDFSSFRSGTGTMLGLGVGAQMITFQLGGRLRTISTEHWNLWNVGGEVMYQPGSGRFWPRFGLNVGYVWAAGFKNEVCAGSCGLLDVSGLSVGARAGVQYFLTKNLEIGADATLDYFKLSRPAINGNAVYSSDGSGNGGMLGILGHIGLHLP